MIPKTINIIWVGDQNRRPNHCIDSWAKLNPDYSVRIWTDDDLQSRRWILDRQIKQMWTHQLCGVADLMRWEILMKHGGIAVDADSEAIRPLPPWILELEAFCASENEIVRPMFLSNGFVGTRKDNKFFADLVYDLKKKTCLTHRRRLLFFKKRTGAWRSTGPRYFSEFVRKRRYSNLTVLPSHFVLPIHYTGFEYTGSDIVYAKQYWGSTFGYSNAPQ